MLPETMFAMETMARHHARERENRDDHQWETWPSTRLDHFALYLWRVVQRLFNSDEPQKQHREAHGLQLGDNPETRALSAGIKASVID